jgi:hypothetical protein
MSSEQKSEQVKKVIEELLNKMKRISNREEKIEAVRSALKQLVNEGILEERVLREEISWSWEEEEASISILFYVKPTFKKMIEELAEWLELSLVDISVESERKSPTAFDESLEPLSERLQLAAKRLKMLELPFSYERESEVDWECEKIVSIFSISIGKAWFVVKLSGTFVFKD